MLWPRFMLSTSGGVIPPLNSPNGYANGGPLLIATGSTSQTFMWSSDEGSTWKTPRGTASAGIQPVADIAFGAGRYFFTTSSNSGQFAMVDLKTSIPTTLSAVYSYVAFGAGRFVAARNLSGNMEYITSVDGITWSSPSTVTGVPIASFAFVGGRFVGYGTGVVTHSVDGITWSAAIPTGIAGTAKSVEFQGGNWLFFGTGSTHSRTTDFSSFSSFTTPSAIRCVSATSSRIYIGRSTNIVQFSTNQGTSWSTESTITGGAGVDGVIEYGGTLYANVRVTISGATYSRLFSETSPSNWASLQILSTSQPNTLGTSKFSDNAFKIVNSRLFTSVGNTVAHTVDGVDWEYIGPEGSVSNRRQLLYLNNTYYAFDSTGQYGVYDSTTDTWTWERLSNLQLPSVAWAQYTNGSFYVFPVTGSGSPDFAFAIYDNDLNEVSGITSIPAASLSQPSTGSNAVVNSISQGGDRWFISYSYITGGNNRYRISATNVSGNIISSYSNTVVNDAAESNSNIGVTASWIWETEPNIMFASVRGTNPVRRVTQSTLAGTNATGITVVPLALLVSDTNWYAVVSAGAVLTAASPNWTSYSSTTVPTAGQNARTWWNGKFYYASTSNIFASSALGGTYTIVGSTPFGVTVLF